MHVNKLTELCCSEAPAALKITRTTKSSGTEGK